MRRRLEWTILKARRCGANARERTRTLLRHLLWEGDATTAARDGASDRSIMRQTGLRRAETVHDCVRLATVFVDNSAGCLDLDTSEGTAGSWMLLRWRCDRCWSRSQAGG